MQRTDFWYPPQLEALGLPPTGTRAGQLAFLSGQLPRDMESGALIRGLQDMPEEQADEFRSWGVHGAGREGPITAQTWLIYHNLSKILESQGSSLQNIVRQRLFLRDVEDIRVAERVMLAFFPGDKPATTIARTATHGTHSEYRIQVEVVARIPEPGGLELSPVVVPGLEPVTAPYPTATRLGQMLFFSGLAGISPDTGRVVTRLSEIDPALRKIVETGRYQTDSAEEKYKSQRALILGHIKAILESQGGGMEHAIRYTMFTTANMTEIGASFGFNPHFHPDQELSPTVTGFTTGQPQQSGDPDVRLILDGVGFVPGGEWQHSGHIYPEIGSGHLAMVRKIGPYIWLTGLSGRDRAAFPITSFDLLKDEGRHLSMGQHDDEMTEVYAAQAWHIYSVYMKLLRETGSSMGHVLHQISYMMDMSKWGGVYRAARAAFGGNLPATTVMGADEIGPFPPLKLEIDAVAVEA